MRKQIIYIFFLAFLAMSANAEKYFVLDVNYIRDSLTFNSVSLREIPSKVKIDDKSGFTARLLSFDGTELNKAYYLISENKRYTIYLPYDKGASKIQVQNTKGSLVMEVDVSSFADTCGDGTCQDYESYESCTKDCRSGGKDNFCDGVADGICDPDCSPKTDVDCISNDLGAVNQTAAIPNKTVVASTKKIPPIKKETSGSGLNYLMIGFALVAIAVLGGGYFLVKKIKENQVVSSLREYVAENVQKGYNVQQIKYTLSRAGYKQAEIDKAIKTV